MLYGATGGFGIAGAGSGSDQGHYLGEGASCTVYLAHIYGVSVAVKAITNTQNEQQGMEHSHHSDDEEKKKKKTKSKKNDSEEQQFMAEMRTLMKIRHPNICRLLVGVK